MAIVTFYNHTRARFLSGANAVGDTYRINLYTALPENAPATPKSSAAWPSLSMAVAASWMAMT
jgi:hypothetical protein